MANRVRAEQLLIRVTPEEKAFILEKMKVYGTNNLNRYARKMLMNGYVIQVNLTDFQKLADEVNKIGVNINQIARTVNTTGTIYSDDIFISIQDKHDPIHSIGGMCVEPFRIGAYEPNRHTRRSPGNIG